MPQEQSSNRVQAIAQVTLTLVLLGWAALLPSCAWDGHFNVAGYSTKSTYDTRFKTVRVPIFRSKVFWSLTPAPGLEMDLTRAVVREIERKTPYKVVQGQADTELTGTIVNFTKQVINYTQFNTIREAETSMTVELVWQDCNSGETLTKPARRRDQPGEPEGRRPLFGASEAMPNMPGPNDRQIGIAAIPENPGSGVAETPRGQSPDNANVVVEDGDTQTPQGPPKRTPITLRSLAHFRPELGESITTAMQRNIDRMATLIVEAMEFQDW
jgi:hypothetical protein